MPVGINLVKGTSYRRKPSLAKRLTRYLFSRNSLYTAAGVFLLFRMHVPQEIYALWPSNFYNAPVAAVDVPSGYWSKECEPRIEMQWPQNKAPVLVVDVPEPGKDGCVNEGGKFASDIWREAASAEDLKWLPSRIIYHGRVRRMNEGYYLSRTVYRNRSGSHMSATNYLEHPERWGMDRSQIPQTLAVDLNRDGKIGNKRVTWEKRWKRPGIARRDDRRVFANPIRLERGRR